MSTTQNGTTTARLERLFARYLLDSDDEIPPVANPVLDLLGQHFGEDASTLPTTSGLFPFSRSADLHLAIEDFRAVPGRSSDVVGVTCPTALESSMGCMTFARLLCRPTFGFVPPVLGPASYFVAPIGPDTHVPVLRQGLILIEDADGPVAIWVHYSHMTFRYVVEVMAQTWSRASAVLAGLRDAGVRLSPYRGQMLSVRSGYGGPPFFTFLRRLEPVARDEVILPDGLLDRIERHALGIAHARDVLHRTNRPLKRGILLHGRPGTGKTHTIKYLLGQMPDATVVLMNAARMHDISVLKDIVDLIQPGVVVLDDVDLIARDRELVGSREQLFALLDTLDGIDDDADLLFVLTTNRPNEIEPAIAARPGRVDQALEVPLPDAACRSRLFDLYAEGLDVDLGDADRERFLARTEGVTASFIREALRRAAVDAMQERSHGDSATERSEAVTIDAGHLDRALDVLLDPGNPLTAVLLGAVPKHALPTITVSNHERGGKRG